MIVAPAWWRRLPGVLLGAAALAAGCGDDEGRVNEVGGTETSSSTTTTPAATSTDSGSGTSTTTDTAPASTAPDGTSRGGGADSPEDQTGGAGDEVPARSVAAFRGRAGGITPRRVRVPPFIAIRVELRSVDGASYRLRARGRTLTVGGRVSTMAATFAGLRPGRRLTLTGPSGRAVVEASAEPGP